MNALTKVPSLKTGDDAAAAKELAASFQKSQRAMREIVSCGLLAWEIKTNLRHGEFGPWLAAHCPKLARADASTGKPKASDALTTYMRLTAGVLEAVGYTGEKYFAHISKFPNSGICQGGKYLLLPDKMLPEEVRPLKEKICSLVDGKTQRQLFMEFKQAEEDETGAIKPKRGRLKGEGGRPPAATGTIDEVVMARRKAVLRLVGVTDDTLNKLGYDFMALPDDQLTAFVSTLERTAKCINTWLNTPTTKRNLQAVADLYKSL